MRQKIVFFKFQSGGSGIHYVGYKTINNSEMSEFFMALFGFTSLPTPLNLHNIIIKNPWFPCFLVSINNIFCIDDVKFSSIVLLVLGLIFLFLCHSRMLTEFTICNITMTAFCWLFIV